MSPSARDDYLMRLIAGTARALARAAGLRRGGRLEEALEELRGAAEELLGPVAELVPRLDSATAAQIVNDPERILAWARLVREEAEARRPRGEPQADALARRALELALEAWARGLDRAGAGEEVLALAEGVPEEGLAPEQRAALESLRRARRRGGAQPGG